ncbi:MAG TPA: redoxin domain-containing protein [Chthonomonadaceae bacterium]|nr:redoxin domain-containing protein [Chthonomonadaceae bacterium]
MNVKNFTEWRPSRILLLCGGAAAIGLAAWGGGPASGTQKPAPGRNAAVNRKATGPITFQDVRGKTYGAADIAAHKATVFLFVSGQCPVSNAYSSRFVRLAADYGTRGVQVFGVYSDRQESLSDITRHAQRHGYTFPIVKDMQNALADRLGATMTPQAIVLDATGAVRYRGRIDDNAVSTRVTSRDLNDALDAVLAGRPVAHPQTAAFGCAIRRVSAPVVAAKGVPTYARDVAPILRAKCETCHRDGEVAPFSLQTYRQASAWAADIKRYTQNRQMPPWKPAPDYGEFLEAHDRSLTDREIATLAKWADAGAPLGDPKQVPPPRKFTQGWQLGEPDVVLEPDRDFHLAADGDDVFRNFVIKTDFPEDRYVRAVEIRAGNRAVVHHVINFIDTSGAALKLEAKSKDGQPGYSSFGGVGFFPSGMLGGWAPGNDPHFLPDGVGNKLPKGACIVIQVHYHKNGTPQTDRTKIGLHFARTTIDKQVHNPLAINFGFKIPPGAERYEVKAGLPVLEDVHVLAVTPHMHLLGKEIKVWATLPDGTEKPLVWIKDWDYNWQATYFLKQPMALPRGSKVSLVAYYDNSAKNPRNPNRANPRPVGWGEQTTDEMCIAFLTITRDAEHLAHQPAYARTAGR